MQLSGPKPENSTLEEPVLVVTEYKHDNSVVQASLAGLMIQLFLAVAIAVAFVFVRFSGGIWIIPFVEVAFLSAEFGLGLFLCHCVFLFPRESPSRILGGIGSVVIAGVQLAAVSSGYGLGPLFVYVVGVSVTGWVMHRVFGAGLSMYGADIVQDALNTKVLLLLAPLMILLGIVPIVTFTAMAGGQMPPDFAAMIIYSSLAMIGVSVVPILTIYLGFFVLRLRSGVSMAAMVVVVSLSAAPMILEWVQFSSVMNSAWITVIVLSHFGGLGLAYLPFHLHGFRPVWAKRKHKSSAESSVSFDEIS